MKKIVFLSEESIFSGFVRCGIAEVVDSLANSLADKYEVSVVCLSGNSEIAHSLTDFEKIEENVEKARFLKVNYFLINEQVWPERATTIIDQLKPDILHNFYEPEIIINLKNKPAKAFYTFDDVNFLLNKEKYLKYYNSVTTFSKGYADYIMKLDNLATKELKNLNFKRISVGVIEDFFSPRKGLLLPAPYDEYNQFGKEKSKQRLKEKYNIPKDHLICLTMCRLVKEKGIDNILKAIPSFKDQKITFLIIGEGEKYYEEEFFKLTDNNVVFINKLGQPFQICPIAAGADFYLQPSLMETGGLMPMTMSLYGTIPIVTQNGGLADNFNEENAIIVKNNDVFSSLKEAIKIYNNPIKLEEKRRICMTQGFSWSKRKQEFINLYEAI